MTCSLNHAMRDCFSQQPSATHLKQLAAAVWPQRIFAHKQKPNASLYGLF